MHTQAHTHSTKHMHMHDDAHACTPHEAWALTATQHKYYTGHAAVNCRWLQVPYVHVYICVYIYMFVCVYICVNAQFSTYI